MDFPQVFQIYCLRVAQFWWCLFQMDAKGSWNGFQGGVQASVFFRFGVKSFGPLRTEAHLKPDHKLRASSCPRQERK